MRRVHVLDRLLEISLLLQADMARSFAGSGLTVARTHLLWELHQLGPSTQQRLATALQVSPRNVTGLVDALVAGGFVTRQPHPNDRRATLVTLTDLGARTMSGMERDREHFAAELLADLDEDALAQLGRALDAVTARLHHSARAAETGA
ncbi:MAG TPA: MarR family transcriptional regulator [Mycobacteriales bacterium]|jgi:DNA-binding MarR family transcriptional regulator|nr:MarR family transcriptional regulator [Mycobacteriales bacterium]